MEQNRRKFSRVKTGMPVVVRCGDKVLKCDLLDVSMGGVRFSAGESFPLHRQCDVTICLEGTENGVGINLQGEIVRSNGRETSIRITGVDVEGFEHLRNLVLLNAGDDLADQLHEELAMSWGVRS